MVKLLKSTFLLLLLTTSAAYSGDKSKGGLFDLIRNFFYGPQDSLTSTGGHQQNGGGATSNPFRGASSGGPSSFGNGSTGGGTIIVQGGGSSMSEEAVLALEREKTKQLELANAQKLQEEHERNKWFNALTQYHDALKKEQADENNNRIFTQARNMLSWHHQTLREIEAERAAAELERERIRLEGLPQTLAHDLKKTKILHEQSLEKMKLLGKGIMLFTKDKERMGQVALTLTGAAVGIYGAKRGTKVAADYASALLMQPKLVTETSRLSLNQMLMHPIATYAQRTEKLPKAIYNPKLQEAVDVYVHSIKEGKKEGQPFRHALFYGAPGTGKTLLAKKIAKELGLHYAIIPGANIYQFASEEGVKEINKLFDWAEKSQTVLFFDECDALVPSRTNASVSEQSRKIQNTIYARTGTETNKFLMLGATNEPNLLDSAFLSRMDERIEFELPDTKTRATLVKHYFKKYIDADKLHDDGQEHFVWVAQMTNGFSGRELSQLVRSFGAQASATEDKKITKQVVRKVVQQKLAQRESLSKYSSAAANTPKTEDFFGSRHLIDTRKEIQDLE